MEAPFARLKELQVNLPLTGAVQMGAPTTAGKTGGMSVEFGGRISVRVTLLASDGPLLVMVTKYERLLPRRMGDVPTVSVTMRSDEAATLTVTVAVLFAWLGSLCSPLMLPVTASEPTTVGFTVIVMVALAPTARG